MKDPAVKGLDLSQLLHANGAEGVDEAEVIKYMKDRAVFDGSLDDALVDAPFETISLYRSSAHMSAFGNRRRSAPKHVGVFKVMMCGYPVEGAALFMPA